MLTTMNVCSAKEWRGIVPLKSTRADVERLLGPVADNDMPKYYLPDEIVYVQFSKQPCDEKSTYERWNVAPGTVISVRVVPKKELLVTNLHLELSKYKKVQGDHDVPTNFYYVSEDEGFSVEVYAPPEGTPEGTAEIVRGFIYGPSAEDRHLRCSDSTAKKPCGSNRKN